MFLRLLFTSLYFHGEPLHFCIFSFPCFLSSYFSHFHIFSPFPFSLFICSPCSHLSTSVLLVSPSRIWWNFFVLFLLVSSSIFSHSHSPSIFSFHVHLLSVFSSASFCLPLSFMIWGNFFVLFHLSSTLLALCLPSYPHTFASFSLFSLLYNFLPYLLRFSCLCSFSFSLHFWGFFARFFCFLFILFLSP